MNIKRPPNWLVGVVLGCGILTIATSAIFVRLCIESAGKGGVGFSLVLAALRLSMASVLCLPLWRGVHRSYASAGAWKLAIAAGVALAAHFSLWIASLSYTSIAAATTLVTSNPLWVALILWIWQGKKPSKLTGVGIAIALMGGILITLGSDEGSNGDSISLLGNSLALMGAWMASIYLILGQQAQQRGLSLGHYIATAYTISALCLLPLPLLLDVPYRGYPSAVYLYIAIMAAFPQLIGHTSVNWAVRWISPTLVALAILCEPVGATVLGYFALAEVPTQLVLVGATIVLFGVAIAIYGQRNVPSLTDQTPS